MISGLDLLSQSGEAKTEAPVSIEPIRQQLRREAAGLLAEETPVAISPLGGTAGLRAVMGLDTTEYDRFATSPIEVSNIVRGATETLSGLKTLTTKPQHLYRGIISTLASLASFPIGVAVGARNAMQTLLGGGSLEDMYEAIHQGIKEADEVFGSKALKPLIGPETPESQLVGRVVFAPIEGTAMLANKLSESVLPELAARSVEYIPVINKFVNEPNVRGALKIAGDIVGIAALGKMTRTGERAEVARKVEDIADRAVEIAKTEEAVEKIPDEAVKRAQGKILEYEKKKLEAEAAEIAENIDYTTMIKEDLQAKGRRIKKIKQAKKYIADEAIHKAIESIKEKKAKPKKRTKVERKPTADEDLRLIKEVEDHFGKKIDELSDKEIEDYFLEKYGEEITDVDEQTGTREPLELSTDNSPFRERNPEVTRKKREILAGKRQFDSPEMIVEKHVVDVNSWLDGAEDVDIAKAREALSDLAVAVKDPANRIPLLDYFNGDSAAVNNFIEVAEEAAKWARRADRSKIERTGELPEVQLNIMIPVDQLPEIVYATMRKMRKFRDIWDKEKRAVSAKDMYRNRELFEKTGFWLGRDGKWRYEIDDSKAILKLPKDRRSLDGFSTTLGEILDYPELYKAVPEIENMRVYFRDLGSDAGQYVSGGFRALGRGYIAINPHKSRNIKKTLFHELQHAVNDTVGSKFFGADARTTGSYFEYLIDPGEMEARLASRRMNMSKEERRKIPPWKSLDRMLRVESGTKDIRMRAKYGTRLYSGIPFDEITKALKDKFGRVIPHLRDPITGRPVVKFRVKPGGKYEWSVKTPTAVRPHREVVETEVGKKIVPGKWRAKVEERKISGYIIEGYDPLKKEWLWVDTEDTLVDAKQAVKRWEKFLDKERAKLYGGKVVDLYSGIPIDKAAEELANAARKFSGYMKQARGMKKFKLREAFRRAKEEGVRAFVDRSGNIRRGMLKVLGDEGYRIMQKAYLSKGSSALAARMLKQLRDEVYGGLSKKEREILDNLILAIRMIAIAKYKPPGKFKFPKGLGPTESIAYSELFPYIEKISPERAAVIRERARAYFEWMKKPLKDMLDAGLISKQEYNDLIVHNYRRIKLIDLLDVRYKAKVGKKKRTVYDSGIEALAKGRDTDIYEPSSEVMALEVFNRAYGRILNNEANRALLELARKDPENPFARVKEKKGDKIPSGWSRIYVFENGERKPLYISPEMAKEWIISNPEMSYRLSQLIRWLSGSALLRTFATGINWGFALANLPRDIMHAWFAARVFESGKWKPVYSPHFPVYGLQMGRDLITVFRDALLRKGRYDEYIKEGGGMEFLVHQGRLLRRGRRIESPLDKVQDFLGYLGETSEVLTRLAIRERVIRRKARELGTSIEEARKLEDVTKEATFAARNYMDFGQGGGVAKAVDNAIPYLNAAIQGTRGMLRSLKDNPFLGMYKIAQFASAVVGLYIAAKQMAPQTMKSLQGSIDMENNLCIPLGDDFSFIDSRGQRRYIYIKIPLDPSQKFFKTFFEAATDKWLGNEVDVDRVVDSLKQMSPVSVTDLPPTVSGVIGYVTNKDFWLNEDIWRRTERPFGWPKSKEEYIPGETPQVYIDIGKVTGLSPERTRYAVEELVTSGTVWSYLLGEGYEKAFGDLPDSDKQEHIAEVLARMPVIKRFIGITNPYSQFGAKIEKAEEKEELERWIQNRGLELRVEGYLFDGNYSRKDVVDYIKQFKDKDVRERLLDRFKFMERTKDLQNRSFWLSLKGLSPEARARVYVDRLKSASEDERKQLREELKTVILAGGVVTPDFRREVSRLLHEK